MCSLGAGASPSSSAIWSDREYFYPKQLDCLQFWASPGSTAVWSDREYFYPKQFECLYFWASASSTVVWSDIEYFYPKQLDCHQFLASPGSTAVWSDREYSVYPKQFECLFFVSCEVKDYYTHVFLVGQLSFDCSLRMRGGCIRGLVWLPLVLWTQARMQGGKERHCFKEKTSSQWPWLEDKLQTYTRSGLQSVQPWATAPTVPLSEIKFYVLLPGRTFSTSKWHCTLPCSQIDPLKPATHSHWAVPLLFTMHLPLLRQTRDLQGSVMHKTKKFVV